MIRREYFTLLEKLILVGVFLSPFNTLNLKFVYLTISDLIFIAILPIVILKISLFRQAEIINNYNDYRNLIKWWAIATFLIALGFLISLLFSKNNLFKDTIITILQYSFVFIYLPLIFLFVRKDKYKILIKSYIFGLLFVILIGIFIEYAFNSIYLDLIKQGFFIGRIRFGSFLGSNGLTKTIALCIPMIFLLMSNKGIKKFELWLIIIVFTIAIIKASSIGGTIATIIAIILSIVFTKNRKTRKVFIFIGIIAAISLLLIIATQKININTFSNRVVENLLSGDLESAGSYTLKMAIMKEAFQKILTSPFVGFGRGSFMEANIYNQTVHNTYLIIWLEGGLIALAGLMMIIFSSIKHVFNYLRYKIMLNNAILVFVFILIFLLI